MSRLYADQIVVEAEETADGLHPRTFRWHGGRYRVSNVLSRWVEAAPWWRGTGYQVRRDPPPERGGLITRSRTSADLYKSARKSLELPDERWIWRVEASRTGRRCGVYDLCRTLAKREVAGVTQTQALWFLIRSFD